MHPRGRDSLRCVIRLRWDGFRICQKLLPEIDRFDVVKVILIYLNPRRRHSWWTRNCPSEVGRLLWLRPRWCCFGLIGHDSILIDKGTLPPSPADALFFGISCGLVFERGRSAIGDSPRGRYIRPATTCLFSQSTVLGSIRSSIYTPCSAVRFWYSTKTRRYL